MQKLTFSLEQEQVETINEYQNENDINSRSEALRRILAEYEQLNDEYDQLHTEYEELQQQLQQERNKTKQVLEQRDENRELVKYVQDERTMEQKWREAGIGQRLKWRIFGMDTDDE